MNIYIYIYICISYFSTGMHRDFVGIPISSRLSPGLLVGLEIRGGGFSNCRVSRLRASRVSALR